MSKIAGYLAEHLRGEVVSSDEVRNAFSTDGSVLRIKPILAVYPYDTGDVRKVAHFAWQLAEKGHVLPLTTRGGGTSRVGAAIGNGAIVSIPSHFSTIFEVDTKQKLVRLQPGVRVDSLSQTMKTHGLEWPVDVSHPGSTVGGAIANNTFGERAFRYGDASNWVGQIEVVLSNGEIIQTERLSKRQLSKKKGTNGFEGEIYRKLDALIDDNKETVEGLSQKQTSAGYAIAKVKDKKGNFDLTPLIMGSQGTLGIVTEVILKLDVHHPHKESVAITLNSLDAIDELVNSILKSGPDKVEFVDSISLDRAQVDLSSILPDEFDGDIPQGLIFIEYSDTGKKAKSKAKKISKLAEKLGHQTAISDGDVESASEIWQVYSKVESTLSVVGDGHKAPVPVIEDALLSSNEVVHFIEAAHEVGKNHRTKLAFTAHLATGVVHARAQLDLNNLSDRNKLSKLSEDYYKLALKHDGGIAGEYPEGRLRLQQNKLQFTEKERGLFGEIKQIFDSYGILNPGVKVEDSKDIAKVNEGFTPLKSPDSLPRL